MIALQGIGASTGIASGKIKFYKRFDKGIETYEINDVETELRRYYEAVKIAKKQLDELCIQAKKEAGEEISSLFETHQLMLEDLDFVDSITSQIRNDKINAEAAINNSSKQFSQMFEEMDDEYMQARSADVTDISTRLIKILTNSTQHNGALTEPSIICADDLTPGETLQLDKSKILGFILSGGSKNGHTSILARTLLIPAIVSVGDKLTSDFEEREVMMDGGSGQIIIDPDIKTKQYFEEKKKEELNLKNKLVLLKGRDDITKDGKKIKLYSNISNVADLDAVEENDSKGIGLFRSEFIYLDSSDYPTEERQFEIYSEVLKKMNGKPVIVRTLDIGADKKIDYFKLPQEENPSMGMRAIRICLTKPEIFYTQLRALYRASVFGNLSIMFPMIASLWEIQEIKRICSSVKIDLRREHISYDENVKLGIMIETPAAVMISDMLAKEVDFFSIGTNDLTQYCLAADRQGSGSMDRFFDPKHPAVMRMIKMTVDNAHENNIWAGVCGELAGDSEAVSELLKIGVDELSVSPGFTLSVRNVILNF